MSADGSDLGSSTKVAAARKTAIQRLMLLARKDTTVVISVMVVAVLIFAAVLGPGITPFDPAIPNLSSITKPPLTQAPDGRVHLLGTDQLGRDLFSRIIVGARISAGISVLAALIGAFAGVLLGVMAGWLGGWVDEVILRLTDVQLAFPYILLILVLAVLMPQSWLTVVFVLAVTRWPMYCRVIRGEMLLIRGAEYIQGARALGASDWRQVFRHALPNCLSAIMILFTFDLAQNISSEAIISFLGAGVPPSTPTWGRVLADSRNYLSTAWWLATFPGLAITLSLLALNTLGDWLRDLLDPRIARNV